MPVAKSISRFDTMYRRMVLSQFFTKGWGNPENLLKLICFRKFISNREDCYKLVDKIPTFTIVKDETVKNVRVLEYQFHSPFVQYLPGVVPPESQTAYFQMIVPLKWERYDYRPMCIHLAGTGDHYYFRRRAFMANPLLKHGIGSIILENPFYGFRKPASQKRSCLHNVSDIFVMGGCLVLECIAILKWLKSLGYGPLGVSGISMGGHMASLAATNWPEPIVCVPCLSWTTASSVFTKGVMAESINWNFLEEQYHSHPLYYNEISKLARIIDKIDVLTYGYDDYLLNTDVNVNQKYTNNSTALLNGRSIAKYLFLLNLMDNPKPRNAVNFMQAIMDDCTHLLNFSKPVATDLATVIAAKHDAYVPRDGLTSYEEVWPGADVRYLDAGHVSAYVYYLDFMRKSIVDTFNKAREYQ